MANPARALHKSSVEAAAKAEFEAHRSIRHIGLKADQCSFVTQHFRFGARSVRYRAPVMDRVVPEPLSYMRSWTVKTISNSPAFSKIRVAGMLSPTSNGSPSRPMNMTW